MRKPTRRESWLKGMGDRLRAHPWRWGVVFSLVGGWLLGSLIDYAFGNWFTIHIWAPLLTPVGGFFLALANQRVGWIGLFLAACVLLLFLLSFFDTSEHASVLKEWLNKTRPPKRSKEHEDLVADIMEVWSRVGDRTTCTLAELYSSAIFVIREKNYLFYAMQRQYDDFKAVQNEFGLALYDRTVPLKTVRKRFNEMYLKYRELMLRLADIQESVDAFEDNVKNPLSALDAWRTLHRDFRDRLHTLVCHADHVNTLRFYLDANQRMLLPDHQRSFLQKAGEFGP